MKQERAAYTLQQLFYALVIVFSIAYASGLLGAAKNFLLPIFTLACGLAILVHFQSTRFRPWAILVIFALLLGVVITFLLSNLGANWLIQSLMSLILAAYLVIKSDLFFSTRCESVVYTAVFILFVLGFTLSVINDELFLIADRDKNFSALLALFFAMYSYKTRRAAGLIVGVIIVLLSASRACQLALIIFAIIVIAKYIRAKRRVAQSFNSKRPGVLFVFLSLSLTGLLIVPFSYFWVNVVSESGFAEYQTSIVDSSNQIRMNSNIYAFEIMSNDPAFLISGYGDETLAKLGISVDASTYSDSTQYGGLRIVQPHNSVLNEVLRNGLLITVLYLCFLSYLIRKYFVVGNAEYIVPVLLISMVMHSVFIQGYLLIWIMVLVIPLKSGWFNKLKKGEAHGR